MAKKKKRIGWKMAWVTVGRRWHDLNWLGRRTSEPVLDRVVLKLEILGRVVKPEEKHGGYYAPNGTWVDGVTKYRTDRVKVLSMHRHRDTNPETKVSKVKSAGSDYDCSFRYVVGKEKREPFLDTNTFRGCGRGIHFFKSRKAAENY